jgi:outer membrane protein assembly factor BamB
MPYDHRGRSYLVALDAKTGKEKWKLDRPGGQASYGTPCVLPSSGRSDQVVVSSQAAGLTGVDLQTGETAWQLRGALPARCVSSPVADSRVVVASCGAGGRGRRLVAVRAEGKTPKLLCDMKAASPYVPTPLMKDGRLFVWGDRGTVTCVDLAGGKQLWQGRTRGQFYGSPVRVAGRLYCIATSGDVHVLSAGDAFKVLAVNPLGEKSHATPAVAGGRMYLRTFSHLISLGGEK